METILPSLITQLKNPWQYICVGAVWGCIVYFDINREYLIPALLCAMGIAYTINAITKRILDQIIRHKWKTQVLFNLLHMNAEEKSVIWYCFSHNIQTTNIDGLNNGLSVWHSLAQKYIVIRPAGTHVMNDLPITITPSVWELIKKNKKKIFVEYLSDESKNTRVMEC